MKKVKVVLCDPFNEEKEFDFDISEAFLNAVWWLEFQMKMYP